MLIAIDIGNSSINIGYFTEMGLFVQEMNTYPLKSPSQYVRLFSRFMKEKNIDKSPEGSIISSVVSGHTMVLMKALKTFTSSKPLIVRWTLKTGLEFVIPNPEGLGSDRIANAVAAYESYKSPVAAVDFGTASAVTVVGRDARYIGGSILPGIRLMNAALAKGTSRLQEAPLVPPASALGVDTAHCIQSGLFYGTAGAVERILCEIEKENGFKLKVVVTGGFGQFMSGFLTRKHELSPHLTLEGLKLIYMRNIDA
jgi:type III pantothenate kinase